jgi:membrane protease YdiL (CAAX protease family)
MSLPSTARVIGIRALAISAAVGLPTLLRSLLTELVAGPSTGAQVLAAQFTFLTLAGSLARLALRTVEGPRPPWRRWAVDAASLAGAQSLLLGARAAIDPRARTAPDLDAVTLVLAAPLVEETLYRGLLPALLSPPVGVASTLPRRLGIAAVASAAFAAAHLGGPLVSGTGALHAFALSFACGLAFHLLRDVSGGLAAPMAAHAGINAMTLPARGW